MASPHILPSGGLLTHQFIEAIQQPSFNHPAAAPETFALPGQKAPAPAELERLIGAAWELLIERWDGLELELPALDISALRERWIRPLFALLDFTLEYQRADLVIEDLRFPISHLGLPSGLVGADLRVGPVPVHTVLPAAGGLDARRPSNGRSEVGGGLRRLAPHDLLQRYLNLSRDCRWGLLCDGLHLRLLRDYHHTYTRGYVEFDLQGIFAGRDFAAFRALYRLCHASRFLPMAAGPVGTDLRVRPAPTASVGTDLRVRPAPTASVGTDLRVRPAAKGKRKPDLESEIDAETEPEEVEEAAESLTPLESFYQHALSTGVKVGEDLRGRVRLAIETLANGFLQATPGLLPRLTTVPTAGSEPGAALSVSAYYADILHTIYRMLFLLFAEQRGMFPARGSLFMEEFSLTALRLLAERAIGEDAHTDLWERLKASFRMVEHGAPGLGVFGYNGALFASAKTPVLTSPAGEGVALRNDSLLRAVRALTTVERDGVLQRISYADLSVEEIGSVYESLLDYTPRVATTPEIIEKREVPAHTFFLDPRGKERKTTGSYYTHPSLVNELIRSALLPVLEERLQAAAPGFDAEHPERLSNVERQAAEAALLQIKVIDPACGSGAFLIAADNALGLRLAQIRSGDLYPAERVVRRARRDVLANCLYAVDLNPLAVELCKLSLWINAVVEDQKLNFLDHHIKCGNSLVGATRSLAAAGIPSEAYGGATGDDPVLARALRKRNDQERQGQQTLPEVSEYDSEADLRQRFELERLAQDDPAEAERRYHEIFGREQNSPLHLAFDLWTAAFFWPLEAEAEALTDRQKAQAGITARRGERRLPLPPTTGDVRQAAIRPAGVDPRQAEFARQLSRQNHFFHWELEFPGIFGKDGPGGFDVVLGNPPWERVKLQEKEFFAVNEPQVAAAANAAARKKLIAALRQTNPAIWALYREALRASECASQFLHASGRYPLTGKGDVNTYSVFAEHDRDLIAPGGRAGIIVPSGIATDFTNKEFFANLVEHGRLASLYDFENRRKLFSEVDSRMKFSLMTLRSAPADGDDAAKELPAEFAFFLQAVDDLSDPVRRFTLTAADFARLNPNTRTCPVFRSRTDAELTRKLYLTAPVLVNETTVENPWRVRFLRMFDMANDSNLFIEKDELIDKGFRISGNRFSSYKELYLPLYEAKMFMAYDHRYAHVEITDNIIRPGQQEIINLASHLDPVVTPNPRYWVKLDDVRSRLDIQTNWLFGYKNITSPTNERSFIGSFLPLAAAGHSIQIILTDENIKSSVGLYGSLNSLVFDFVSKQKLGGINFSYFVLKQLPVLCPVQYDNKSLANISTILLELVYTSWDIRAFADDMWREANRQLRAALLAQWDANAAATGGGHADAVRPEWAGEPDPDGFPRPPFKWDDERRTHLRAELDGLYAHLYGLTRDEFAYILDTFPIVRRKDEAKWGEYRTRRLCLEAYDRLAGSDLIPPEARALQAESVIGGKASGVTDPVASAPGPAPASRPIPSRPVKTAQKAETPRTPQPENKPPAQPQAARPQSASEPPAKPAAAAQPPTPAPQPPAQPPLLDGYTLFRCLGCGKHVMGFDRENHTRDVHGGKEPGYQQTGKR